MVLTILPDLANRFETLLSTETMPPLHQHAFTSELHIVHLILVHVRYRTGYAFLPWPRPLERPVVPLPVCLYRSIARKHVLSYCTVLNEYPQSFCSFVRHFDVGDIPGTDDGTFLHTSEALRENVLPRPATSTFHGLTRGFLSFASCLFALSPFRHFYLSKHLHSTN